MAGMARVILVGYLGKDPVDQTKPDGKRWCTFSVATSKKFREEEVTQWHNVTVFNEQCARFLIDYAHKGTLVYLEGELETRKYEKEGVTHYATDVVLGFNSTAQILKDPTPREDGRASSTRRPAKSYASEKPGRTKPVYTEEQRAADREEFDDEIPF